MADGERECNPGVWWKQVLSRFPGVRLTAAPLAWSPGG